MSAKKILVVDDDNDLVASIDAFLGARGFVVTTAGNSKEAYKRIVEDKPDLIVLDVMMDYDEEGMVLASALKTDGPTRDIPIVSSSASKPGATESSAGRTPVPAFMTSATRAPRQPALSSRLPR